MARPVDENIEKNPTAISRPEGGWFARIWNERSKSVKHLINLGRSEPFTVWVRSIEKCEALELLDEDHSDSEEFRSKDDGASQVELVSLPPSKAFSIWTKWPEISQKRNDEIPSLPLEAFEESQPNADESSIQPDRDNLIRLTSKCFTIWITPEALADPKFVRLVLTENENDVIKEKAIIDSATKDYPEESNSKETQSVFIPIVFSFLLVTAIIWMFVRANELASVKDELSSVNGKILIVKEELAAKTKKIFDLEQTFINERNANKKASSNAKEVARLEIRKANEAFLGKVKEVELLVQARDKIRGDYEKAKALSMQEIQKLQSKITNIEEKNIQAQDQILQADKNNEILTKKVAFLEKEKSELNKAMSDVEAANKKARDNYLTAIQAVENELKNANEMLSKERSNTLIVREKLGLSDSRLKELMLEIKRLNAKINELEQLDQPFIEE